MAETTLFKFGKWTDYGKSRGPTPKVKNFPSKGRGLGHVTFKILNSHQYFWNGWIYTLNLAGASNTANPTAGVEKSPWKGRGLGHVIVFEILKF